ncbi:unnamed protein product [Discosporangium mesarthrocarpum]
MITTTSLLVGRLCSSIASRAATQSRLTALKGPTHVQFFSTNMSEQRKTRVMFVCKRNSCRSQMAEGWAKAIARDKLDVESSGLEGSRVHPTAQMVMQEVGVDITSHTSDFLDDFQPEKFDAVISMCGCKNRLPKKWTEVKVFEDWELDDPDGQPLDTFRRVRSEIREHIEMRCEKRMQVRWCESLMIREEMPRLAGSHAAPVEELSC